MKSFEQIVQYCLPDALRGGSRHFFRFSFNLFFHCICYFSFIERICRACHIQYMCSSHEPVLSTHRGPSQRLPTPRFFNPEEMQALRSQNLATDIRHLYQPVVSRVDTAMPSHPTMHDLHIIRTSDNQQTNKTNYKEKF